MSYIKKVWANGITKVNQGNMNNIENQVEALSNKDISELSIATNVQSISDKKTAPGKIKFKGKSYVNIFGTDGKGDTLNGWVNPGTALSTDGEYVYNNVDDTGGNYLSKKVQSDKYYMLQGVFKTDATVHASQLNLGEGTTAGASDVSSDVATFKYDVMNSLTPITLGKKFKAGATTEYVTLTFVVNNGQKLYVKELLITEITEAEFNTYTFEELQERYIYTEAFKHYDEILKSVGKNLFDKNSSKLVNGTVADGSGNFSLNPVTTSYILNIEGFFDSNLFYSLSQDVGARSIVGFYEQDPEISGTGIIGINGGNGNLKIENFQIPSTAKYMAYYVDNANLEPDEIQLEKGASTTDYEEYRESNSRQSGKSLPNGVTDTESLQNVSDEFLFDGDENWSAFVSSRTTISYAQITSFVTDNNIAHTDGVIAYNGDLGLFDIELVDFEDNSKPQIIIHSNNTMYLALPKTSLATDDLSGFLAYLAADPVAAIFQLETPISRTDNNFITVYEDGQISCDYLPTELSIETANNEAGQRELNSKTGGYISNRLPDKRPIMILEASKWVDDTSDSGYWIYDIEANITQDDIPFVNFSREDIEDGKTAAITEFLESFDGYIRVYAFSQLSDDVRASVLGVK